MKVTVIPSAFAMSGTLPPQYLTSILINDSVVIDCGSIGFYKDVDTQARVKHIFLSHSHLDHVASLPVFLENVVGLQEEPVRVYACESVQTSLREDLFNDRVWPNFLEIKVDGRPFLALHTLVHESTVHAEGLRITPVRVDHVTPTMGFIIEDDSAAVVLSSDTGPTTEIWKRASQLANLKAVFLEATFPNCMQSLAEKSMHFTSQSFLNELQKLNRPDVPCYALHLKASFRTKLAEEIAQLKKGNVHIAEFDKPYEF